MKKSPYFGLKNKAADRHKLQNRACEGKQMPHKVHIGLPHGIKQKADGIEDAAAQ